MTMPVVRVHDVLKERILVSRESARLLEDAVRTTLASAPAPENASCARSVTVDFEEVAGVAPSFLDELLTILESLVRSQASGQEVELIVANPPTRLSLKFEAIARGHGMSIQGLPDGSWRLAGTRTAPTSG
jgi:hypothetical protein